MWLKTDTTSTEVINYCVHNIMLMFKNQLLAIYSGHNMPDLR